MGLGSEILKAINSIDYLRESVPVVIDSPELFNPMLDEMRARLRDIYEIAQEFEELYEAQDIERQKNLPEPLKKLRARRRAAGM